MRLRAGTIVWLDSARAVLVFAVLVTWPGLWTASYQPVACAAGIMAGMLTTHPFARHLNNFATWTVLASFAVLALGRIPGPVVAFVLGAAGTSLGYQARNLVSALRAPAAAERSAIMPGPAIALQAVLLPALILLWILR